MPYKHDADRLASQYESSGKLEDYIAANEAYGKLINSGMYTNDDLIWYAYLQDCHSSYYVKKAIELYNKAIDEGKNNHDASYYKAHCQLIVLLAKNNRSHESIERYKQMVRDEPGNWRAYQILSNAYFWAKQYDDAWLAIEAAMKFEPNNAGLLSEAGYVLKALGRYDEAIKLYDKSLALDNNDAGSLYGKACLYMDTNRNKEAITAWEDVVTWLEAHGYSVETDWPKREIEKLKNKIIK
ncbi:MAG: TPR-domain containing protein [Clostridia bacterium]|nr:TPR-domain containing protein [Clostridia bacterium]